jgi:hypothetical protein
MMIGYLSNGKNKGSFYGEVVRWMRKYWVCSSEKTNMFDVAF